MHICSLDLRIQAVGEKLALILGHHHTQSFWRSSSEQLLDSKLKCYFPSGICFHTLKIQTLACSSTNNSALVLTGVLTQNLFAFEKDAGCFNETDVMQKHQLEF